MKLKLIGIGKTETDRMAEEYKKNYEHYSNMEELYSRAPKIKFYCQSNKLLYDQISRALKERRPLQSTIIEECIIVDVFAKANNFVLVSLNENSSRAVYRNAHSTLIYYGDPAHNDMDVITDEKVEHYEFKSIVSRAGDTDLMPYNIDGTTQARKNTQFDTKEGRQIIDYFNQWHKNWNNSEHNFRISDFPDVCNSITREYFSNIDYCIVVYKTYIMLYTVDEEFFSLINYDNSEIRTTGKNKRKVENKEFLDNWINTYKPIVNQDTITIPLDKVTPAKARGSGNKISRYKLGMYTMFVLAEKCTIKDNMLTFKRSDAYYTIPNGSIHLNFKESK